MSNFSQNNKNEQSGIERLKKSFYKKGEWSKRKTVKLKPQTFQTKNVWDKKTSDQNTLKQHENKPRKKMSFFSKLLIFSVFFFLMSFGVAFLVFYGGVNVISTKNVDISITGPLAIGGGEELSFQVMIQNNNSVDLELTDLIVEYPTGTLSMDGEFKELIQTRKSLGTISAGGSATNMFKSALFGAEGDKKDIIVIVEYRAKGSNAIFFKERKYEVLIDSSAVGFVIDFPKETMSGQEFEFSVDISSNSNKIIKDFLFVADFPFGFDFKDSNIKPTHGDNVWNLGDIHPNSKMTVKIKGILEGQDGEERVFRFSGGVQGESNENEIRAALVSAIELVFIKKTLIGLELVLNGDYSPEYIASSGKSIRADILWSNNLPTRLIDGKIIVELNGTVLNKASVFSDKGFYRSSDNTIIWDRENNPQLELLNPGANGNLSFSFSPHALSFISNSGIKNPEIMIKVTINGNRLSDSNSVETVSTVISKQVKVNSDLLLTARTLYSVGAFENSGPIPPQVDKETTYTVVWTLTNTSSDIYNAKVRASLPPYVRWAGVTDPLSEDISFNQVGGEIIWDIGTIKAGQGVSTAAEEVSFQIVFLPSLSQVGSEPILVDDIFVEGLDGFTDILLEQTVKSVTTRFSTDPLFNLRDEKVVQ